jgi:hypothetical protein
MEDTTQEAVVEAPVEDKVEASETQGVEQEVNEPTTPVMGQSEEEQEAQAEKDLFRVLAAQKGLDPEDPKSIQKVAKMFMDAESAFTKKSQDYATLEKLTEAILSEDDAPSTDTDKEVKELKADRDIRLIAEKYNDFGDYVDTMSKVLKETPNASLVFSGTKGVELLYKLAKVDQQEEVVAKAREEGKREAVTEELQKAQTEVASGTKAKTPSKKAFTREEIGAMSIEEYNENEKEIKSQLAAGLIT